MRMGCLNSSRPPQSAAQQGAGTATAPPEPHRHASGLSRRALQPGQGDDARGADAPGTSPTGPQSQPSVLAQFLQQHPGGGTTGAGGYSNQSFFTTLNALKQGATT